MHESVPCTVLYFEGHCNASTLRSCVEAVLRTVRERLTPGHDPIAVQWLNASFLPVEMEASPSYAVSRVSAVLHGALRERERKVPPPAYAVLHRFSDQRHILAVALPPAVKAAIGATFDATLLELYSAATRQPLGETAPTPPPPFVTNGIRILAEDLQSGRHGEDIEIHLASAYAIVLALLSGKPQVTLDVCRAHDERDGCVAHRTLALDLSTAATLRDVLSCTRSARTQAGEAVSIICARAGLVLGVAEPEVLSTRCGTLRILRLPANHFADWPFKVTCYDSDVLRVGIEAFFAPATLTGLFLHIYRCLYTNPDTLTQRVTTVGYARGQR